MGSKRIGTSRRVVVGVFLLLAGTVSLAGVMTPEYARGEYRPKSMVLIPPQASVSKNKVASTEQMIGEGADIEDATRQVLQQHLHKLGYDLRVLSVDDVMADPELQSMIRALNNRYDEELGRIMVNPLYMGRKQMKELRSRRFNVGDPARIVAARLGAEALVMARIDASGASGGQKTMAVLFGGSMGHLALNVGIVAGDNGDLEALFIGVDPGMSPQKLAEQPYEVMAKVVDKGTFKDYPAVGEAAKYKKKWPQSTNREVPPALGSDDQALDDLEAMFGEEAPVEEAADVEVEVETEVETDVEMEVEEVMEAVEEEAAEMQD